MKLKEIRRTATFAWSPTAEPLLATGTVAGALDESFSNESFLEIWQPDFMDKAEYELGGQQNAPRAVVKTESRFNRIAWGYHGNGKPRGIIATGMENGELGLWDPEKMLTSEDKSQHVILRNNVHQGSLRGLDFNPIQTNLLSSGATNGEIYIWNLNDPSKPYSPGSRSSKLDEITSLAWNRQVQYILASSSNSGYTVVWDLRNKREVATLQYGGQNQAIAGGGRAGMSDVAWHPDNSTRLVTASDDDSTPVVMLWDLRNAHAPVKLLTGHEKGVLSLSWCRQDADLLLSCGKDNRTLCWNPQSAEIIGELPYSANWTFHVEWCPRNPDLIAAADFDGAIGVHSLQSTNDSPDGQQPAPTPKADGSDVFDVPSFPVASQSTLSLKQPPKWLRRPISSSFGYGGKLVSVCNLQSAQGTTQSSVVHLRKLVTEPTIVERAKKLKTASEGNALDAFAKEKADIKADHADETWRALSTLFTANSKDELVTLLGFSKAESATRVSEAVEKIKANVTPTIPPNVDIEYIDVKPHEPIVSFAEPELTPTTPEADLELTPSEQSTSVNSDTTGSTKPADGESTTTVPSLFDDDIGTPQLDAAADFFSSMGTIRSALPEHSQIPHQNYAHDSSVAATIGSRPSSAASETMKSNTFRIYPSEESDIDSLVTKSLILGDFESAVTLCLSAERYADAILLAVKGSPELLQRTQKAYFEKRTVNLPYLRLFQSIVTEDLDDIVQNADLQEWQEIFVVLCTFAKADEFSNLAEQLGQRLEFQASLMKNMESPGSEELRKNATLAYLAAGRLEKVINIWIEEMSEDEAVLVGNFDEKSSSRYTAHAHALQTLMEKVAIFRGATKYVDSDLEESQEGSAMRTYKLSGLYERYFEYADLLAAQGLLDEAVTFLKLVPAKYESEANCDFDFSVARERLLEAAKSPVASSSQIAPPSSYAPAGGSSSAYAQQSNASHASQQLPANTMSARAMSPAKQVPVYPGYGTNGTSAPSQTFNAYTPLNMTTAPPSQQYQPTAPMHAYNATPSFAPPPRTQQVTAPPPPPPKKKEDGGWNDAPTVIRDRRPPSTNPVPSRVPITAPFPGSGSSPSSGAGSPAMYGQGQPLPPPPRPGSVSRGSIPPPPQGQVRPPPGAQQGSGFHQAPQRTFSPSQQPGPLGPPPPRAPAQYAPPQNMAIPPPQSLAPQQQFSGNRGLAPPPQRGPGVPPVGAQQVMQGPPGWNSQGRPPPGPFPGGSPVVRPGSLGPQRPPSATSPDVYAPPPGNGPRQLPPGMSALGLQQNSQMGPVRAGPPLAPVAQAEPMNPARSPPVKQGPPPPKYPRGDRSHIPAESGRAYEILSNEINRLRTSSVPMPKRNADDIDNRMNTLFDAMNCDTLSPMVIEKLGEISEAMKSRNKGLAMTLHADLLQQSSASTRPEDNIGSWMAAIRQLIMRLDID